LAILSVSLTLPLGLLNFYGFVLWSERKEREGAGLKGEGCLAYILALALMLTAFAVYLPLLICYLFGLNFKWFLAMAVLLSSLMLFDEILARWRKAP
jgi:hypothetical protein